MADVSDSFQNLDDDLLLNEFKKIDVNMIKRFSPDADAEEVIECLVEPVFLNIFKLIDDNHIPNSRFFDYYVYIANELYERSAIRYFLITLIVKVQNKPWFEVTDELGKAILKMRLALEDYLKKNPITDGPVLFL